MGLRVYPTIIYEIRIDHIYLLIALGLFSKGTGNVSFQPLYTVLYFHIKTRSIVFIHNP